MSTLVALNVFCREIQKLLTYLVLNLVRSTYSKALVLTKDLKDLSLNVIITILTLYKNI